MSRGFQSDFNMGVLNKYQIISMLFARTQNRRQDKTRIDNNNHDRNEISNQSEPKSDTNERTTLIISKIQCKQLIIACRRRRRQFLLNRRQTIHRDHGKKKHMFL